MCAKGRMGMFIPRHVAHVPRERRDKMKPTLPSTSRQAKGLSVLNTSRGLEKAMTGQQDLTFSGESIRLKSTPKTCQELWCPRCSGEHCGINYGGPGGEFGGHSSWAELEL